jgi:acyl-CoA synthetase (AMP-forming)/AMP-acid ligase II
MWERNAALYSTLPAVLWKGKKTTFGELVERGRRLADGLYRMGVRREHRVGMLSTNCAEWFDYYVACELHGFIALTVNFRLAPAEIQYVVNDATPTVLLFEEQYAGLVDGLRPTLSSVNHFICIGSAPEWAHSMEDVIAQGSPAGPPVRAESSDGAHLIYTSGTTGRPKGVLRDQRAGLELAASLAQTQNMKVGGRILVAMPLFHVGAQSQSSGQHLLGGMVAVQSKFDPAVFAQVIENERINITHMVPTMVRLFLEDTAVVGRDLSSLETLVYAAAPMPVELLRLGLERLGPIFLNCYGATECGNVAVLPPSLHRSTGSDLEVGRLASVGQEHAFSRLRVLDDNGNECERGTAGELCVQSTAMMRGYWNNHAASVEVFQDGWYRTGDIARMDAEGFVFLIDRRKDMIISGGENVYCREVEEALMSHPSVADVAVIGVADRLWGEAVLAVVVPKNDHPCAPAELIAHSRGLLAAYKCPKRIEFVPELPRVSTGKVNKVALRETYGSAPTH